MSYNIFQRVQKCWMVFQKTMFNLSFSFLKVDESLNYSVSCHLILMRCLTVRDYAVNTLLLIFQMV